MIDCSQNTASNTFNSAVSTTAVLTHNDVRHSSSSSSSVSVTKLSSINNNNNFSRIPASVVNKFEVVNTGHTTVETLISEKINEDARDKEEAFYFIDLGAVVKKYDQWVKHLPRVKPFYAVKCNPNTAIVQTLASLGANFDCASSAEISQVLGSNVAPSRIIYANPTKMKSHINFAKANGVEMMTFDNADELKKIAAVYPEAKLVLRIITDDSHSVCRFSTKFGAPLNVCESLLTLAKELGLNIMGISFHVGSGCMNVQSFEGAIRNAHKVFQMAEKLGHAMTLLDLGGGWPGTDEDGICFNDIANHIRPILDDLFAQNVQIIAEPGRYFVAASHTLVVNVFAKRTVVEKNEGTGQQEKQFLYYVNDGVYQSFNCIFFDHAAPKPLLFPPSSSSSSLTPAFKSTIFGPTCDSMDCIAKGIEMPELSVGQFLYFKHMGAYTVAAASPFNGFKACPNTYYIVSE